MQETQSGPTVPLRTMLSRRAALASSAVCLAMPRWVRSRPAPLRFGLTPVFLDDRVRLLRRWAHHLEDALGQTVNFVQFGAYSQVVDALRGGQLDLAWICGYPYVAYQTELQLVCIPRWRGRLVYQSYLIGDAVSRVSTFGDLAGRTFVYSDPLSNSGFLYVQHLLRSHQRDPALYFGRTFFTYSHRHVIEAVSQGLAQAGAVDSYVWETLAELTPRATANTRVILRSPEFGFPPLAAPRSLAPEEVARLSTALQGMAGQAEGRAILNDLRLDGFAQPTSGLFDTIAEMVKAQQG